MQKLTKKLTAITLALLMVFSMATVMLHSLAESTASSTPPDSSSSSSVEPKSSSSSEESSSSEDSSVSSSSSLPDDSSSSVSSSKPDDVNPNKTSYLKKATETYEVKFDTNGSPDQPDPQIIEAGGTVTEPAPPTKDNCQFAGWFSDKGLTQKFNFNTPIFSNMTLYAGYDIEVNETTFPDANFRNFVKTTYCNSGNILTQDTINATKTMNCSSKSISDLTGIEYFTALTTLYCFGNRLTSLDVRENKALTCLDCYNNKLKSLDVSHNTDLKYLYCSNNKLKSLDVSENTALTYLDCHKNDLQSLDVSHNTALTILYCSYNPLKNLDVSHNTALKYLYCDSNHLTSLDTSALSSLNTFDGSNQTSTAKCIRKDDGHYIVDMKQIVGDDNISNVENINPKPISYDNGIIDFGETKPSEGKFTYNYDTNPPDGTRLLNVTLNLEYYDGITFEFKYADGSTASDSKLVTIGDKITLTDRPKYDSQCGTYNGKWYKDAEITQEVTSPYTVESGVTTLYAGTTNEVTFDLNGGTIDPPADQDVLYGHKATEPDDPQKDGCQFYAWFQPGETTAFDFENTPITKAITLNATWNCNVTFCLNGGNIGDIQNEFVSTVRENETVNKPDSPIKEGFTFAGWFTDENLTQAFDFNTPITKNITLYAKYDENKVNPSSDDSKIKPTNTNDNGQNSGDNAVANSTATGQDSTLLWACLLTSLISVLSIGEILYQRKKYQK